MENILGIIRGLTGNTSDTIYDLYFSEKRIVAAIVLHHSDLTAIYQKPDFLGVFFGGGLKRSEVNRKSRKLIEDRRTAFKGKTLNELLAMHKANINIEYTAIDSVLIKKGFLTTTLQFKIMLQPQTIKFSLSKNQTSEVETVLHKVLKDKFLKK